MERPKCIWRHIIVYAIMVMWLTSCVNNEFSAPISSVDSNDKDENYSNNIVNNSIVEHVPRLIQPHATVMTIDKKGYQGKISLQKNTISSRNYDIIKKNSYFGTTYQVKQGDTLFYIAWITGNDYRYLAQKNNILKPYSLNVGQILQVSNKIISKSGIPSSEMGGGFVANKSNSDRVISLVSSEKTELIELDVNNKHNGNVKKIIKQSTKKILPTTSAVITNWIWPTKGKIIDNFSIAEGGNKGIDISGSQGQAILATANGRVVYAGNALRGYGNLIIIKHDYDYLSAYAHNDTMLVREQQEVTAGQKIATMGSSGTDSTRLHFEIRYKGKSINPLYCLSQ